MDEPDRFYRALCSSETVRSGSKGFFRDFSESVLDEAGDAWTEKIFARLDSDEERVRAILTDPKVKGLVLETLSRMKHLYRDKDATVSRSKRLEGLEVAASGDHEKALLLFSQAVLRAPATGKFPLVDQGFSLPLGLLARADTLMALRDYDFALEDLLLAAEEDLPQTARRQLLEKIEECNRLLAESDKSLVPCGAAVNQMKKQFKRPSPPPVTGGPNPEASLAGTSRLIDIRETPSAGKHAIAAADIRPGDVLASEPPLASCLLPEFYGTHCQHCLSRLRAPVGCPVCSSVAFCGRKCRDDAMATYHKFECKVLALLIGSGMSVLSTLALRMVTQEGPDRCRVICEKLRKQKPPTDGGGGGGLIDSRDVENAAARGSDEDHISKSAKRRLRKKKLKENTLHSGESSAKPAKGSNDGKVDMRAYDLVTLATKRSAKDFLERTLMAVFLLKGLQKVHFFKTPSKTDEPPADDEVAVGALLLRNLQLLQFNAHEIYETRLANDHRFRGNKTVYVGIAIYSSVARFNHDCYPAVTRYYAGRHIVIRALRPLKPGDVVAENYGPIFTKKCLKERQRSLTGRYWFRCVCLACTEDWPGFDGLENYSPRLRCPTEGCKGLFAQPRRRDRPMKCSKCLKTRNLEESLRILAECEAEYTRGLDAIEAERSDEAAEILKKALEKFHRVAAPPHRETHLAEIAFAACFADSGNTWRPIAIK